MLGAVYGLPLASLIGVGDTELEPQLVHIISAVPTCKRLLSDLNMDRSLTVDAAHDRLMVG